MCSPSWFGKNRKLVGHTKSTLKTQRESKTWSCARELKGLPLGTYLSQQGFTSWTALPAGRWVFSGVNQATGNFFTLSRQPINTSFRRVVAIPVPDLLYQVVKLHRSDFRTTTQIMSIRKDHMHPPCDSTTSEDDPPKGHYTFITTKTWNSAAHGHGKILRNHASSEQLNGRGFIHLFDFKA